MSSIFRPPTQEASGGHRRVRHRARAAAAEEQPGADVGTRLCGHHL
ncbi:hypothetical protein ACWEQ7_09470 [Streptomyces sp. NPDC004069]